MKTLHLARWRDESVANKCGRCPDSARCPGYVPRASRELLAPADQPSERRKNGKKRPPTRERKGPEQLPLQSVPSASKARRRIIPAAEQAAKAYIASRAKPSVVPGHVKLTFTLDIPRAVAEQLSAKAIRKGVHLDAVVVEILGKSGPK